MPDNEPSVKVTQFLGLRNKDRPARLPVGALVEATNIDIDDSGGIELRQGYSALAGLTAVTAAYATEKEQQLLVVDGGILKRVLSLSPLVTAVIAIGVPAGEVWWDDNDGHVFCSGALNGIIYGDTFTPYGDWGEVIDRTLDVQGETLLTDEADVGTSPPPAGTECVAFFQSAVWLSYHDGAADQSFVFHSKPFFWSRFDLGKDYIAVPGRVLLLAKAGDALIIGTDRAIHAYNPGAPLATLADYGVVPGPIADKYEGKVYFWTQFGLCRALPFEEMTMNDVYVPCGTRACLAVVAPNDEFTRVVVVTSQ